LATSRPYFVVGAVLAVSNVLADVVVERGVLEALASGRARVVVELNLPGFDAEGELGEERARTQRQAIAASQQMVLAALAAEDVQLIRRHQTVPFLALEIGPPALASLQARPDLVIRILEDRSAAANRPE
jgi:hypothetical protein